MEVEVRDKRKTIDALRQALAEAREHQKQAMQDALRDWEEKMQKQKSQYEAGMERHLKLVDRLLTDKTELTKRCELFTEELKAVERKFQIKMEEMDEQASRELERQKRNWMAAEKLRRESWEKDKVREIKEITIKGLQPEVERILAERKQEKHRLEERHQEVLEAQRRDLTEMAQAQVREGRERLVREQERALEEEREGHRRKAREEFERFTSQLQEERTRCAADVLAERRRHEQALAQGSEGFETRLSEAIAVERAKAEVTVREALEKVAKVEEQHCAELTELREQLRQEAELGRNSLVEQSKTEMARRETELRQEMTAERNRQVDSVVERLSREQVEQHQTLKEEADARVEQAHAASEKEAQRLAGQLEKATQQVRAMEAQHSVLQETIQGFRDRCEADVSSAAGLEKQMRHLEADNSNLRREIEQGIQGNREELWRAAEMNETVVEALRQKLRAAEERLEDERARATEQQAAAKQNEESLISNLEARVKRTVQAKDDTIGELRSRCAASENQVREFEYLLARQREELLGEITRTSRA